jgi:NTP pyrophosphatase (non-canonical NTP hydrolase)
VISNKIKGKHIDMIICDDVISEKDYEPMDQKTIYAWFNQCFDYQEINSNVFITYIKQRKDCSLDIMKEEGGTMIGQRSQEEQDMIRRANNLMDDHTSVDIYGIAEICALIEKGNGFETANDRTIPSKLMLVVTEIQEAVSWCNQCIGDPLQEELADIMIRLMAMIHWYGIDELKFDGWTWYYSQLNFSSIDMMKRIRLKNKY